MALFEEWRTIKEGDRSEVSQTPRSLWLSTVGTEVRPLLVGRDKEGGDGFLKAIWTVFCGLIGRRLVWAHEAHAFTAFCKVIESLDQIFRSSAYNKL
jgi:hypothetical protein